MRPLTIYQQTKAVLDKLGDLYIDITMITGESPDSNRDYELHKQVPDFSDRLKEYSDSVRSVSDQMKGISGGDNRLTLLLRRLTIWRVFLILCMRNLLRHSFMYPIIIPAIQPLLHGFMI